MVQDHLQAVVADAFDHLGVKAKQPLLTHPLVVERRQQHYALCSRLDGVAGQGDGVSDRGGRCPWQEALGRHAAFDGGVDQGHAFSDGERVRLARGAEHRDPVTAFLEQECAVSCEEPKVGFAFGRNRRRGGAIDALNVVSHHFLPATSRRA
jgi:hypothetical protein